MNDYHFIFVHLLLNNGHFSVKNYWTIL